MLSTQAGQQAHFTSEKAGAQRLCNTSMSRKRKNPNQNTTLTSSPCSIRYPMLPLYRPSASLWDWYLKGHSVWTASSFSFSWIPQTANYLGRKLPALVSSLEHRGWFTTEHYPRHMQGRKLVFRTEENWHKSHLSNWILPLCSKPFLLKTGESAKAILLEKCSEFF